MICIYNLFKYYDFSVFAVYTTKHKKQPFNLQLSIAYWP
jgi:hypothetical protein